MDIWMTGTLVRKSYYNFFFVPRKWKAKGRACVSDSARPTAARIFTSSRALREEAIRLNDGAHSSRNIHIFSDTK